MNISVMYIKTSTFEMHIENVLQINGKILYVYNIILSPSATNPAPLSANMPTHSYFSSSRNRKKKRKQINYQAKNRIEKE